MKQLKFIEEQDINFTDDAFALNTGKNARQCEPSKTSFFRLDKNYRPREYDKTNKMLPLTQTENISAGMSGTLCLCDICNKDTNHNLDQHVIERTTVDQLAMVSSILLHRWKTHQLKIINSRSAQDLNGVNMKKLNLRRC